MWFEVVVVRLRFVMRKRSVAFDDTIIPGPKIENFAIILSIEVFIFWL